MKTVNFLTKTRRVVLPEESQNYKVRRPIKLKMRVRFASL